jgi:outer membrane protein TolC
LEGEMVRKDIMKENYKMGISLKQLIFDSGRTKSLIKSKKGDVNFAYLEYQKTKQELIYKVKESYFNILIAKNLLNLAEEKVNLYKKHLQMISAKEKQGMATYQERLKCETEISQANLNFLNASNYYQLCLSSLNLLLGRDINSSFELEDYEIPDDFNLSYEECLKFAYKNRIELKQINIQEEISKSLLNLAKAEKYPSISTTATYEYYDEKYPPKEATYNIGILFTFPLYDGGSRNSNVEKAKIQVELKKIQEEKIKQSISLEVKEAYQNLISAKERMKIAEIYLKQTEENLKMIEKKYNLGMANLIELLDVKNLYIQANTDYIKEKYNFYISKAKLEKVIGEEL